MARRKTDRHGLSKPSRSESEQPEEAITLINDLESRDWVLRKRSSDPGDGNPEDGDLPQDNAMLYISDGSGSVTGSSGDLIVAQNEGGTVQTAIVQSRSGMS